MRDDQRLVQVIIGGRNYSVKINPEDEGRIKSIVKSVNDQINQFQANYSKKDVQDCLAMTLLTYAVELDQYNEQSFQDPQLEGPLTRIETLLAKGIA